MVESRYYVSGWLYSPWGCPARRGCRWCEVSGRGTPSTHYMRRMEAASYGECRVVVHTTCFRLQLHQIGAVSCYDRCWVHHRCRNLTVPELRVAPNRSCHPNAIMRLEPKVILTVVLRHYPTWNLPFNNSFILFSVATIEKPKSWNLQFGLSKWSKWDYPSPAITVTSNNTCLSAISLHPFSATFTSESLLKETLTSNSEWMMNACLNEKLPEVFIALRRSYFNSFNCVFSGLYTDYIAMLTILCIHR